jgi:chromate transport protein ChrA
VEGLLLIAVSLLPLGLIIDGLNTGTLLMVGRATGRYSRSAQPFWFWLSIALYAVIVGWCWYTAAKSLGV